VKSIALSVWMDPMEFAQLLAAIEAVAPKRFLEWGTGGSTKAILARCPFIAEYVAVEHNRPWFLRVKDEVTDPRLNLHHVGPDQPLPPGKHREPVQTAWDEATEFDRPKMASYIDFPGTLGGTFDFVLVDGRARRFCVAEGFKLLNPGGMLCVHDAQRTEYHDAILAQTGRALFLEPWKQGQICLVHKPRA